MIMAKHPGYWCGGTGRVTRLPAIGRSRMQNFHPPPLPKDGHQAEAEPAEPYSSAFRPVDIIQASDIISDCVDRVSFRRLHDESVGRGDMQQGRSLVYAQKMLAEHLRGNV